MATKKYGIIGWPVKHSRSPQMQMAAFNALDINARYDLIPVKIDEFSEQIEELVSTGYQGLNVTVPHKSNIIPFLNQVEDVAEISGSVNTVTIIDGKLHGYSTDGYGLAASLKESFNLDITNKSFLFWGTGGAAVAASTHFSKMGARTITLVNRTLSKAVSLKDVLEDVNPNITVNIFEPNDLHTLATAFVEVDVIIQSTSIGLDENDPLSIPHTLLTPSLKIVDMIYSETKLMRHAGDLGCDVIDGKGMLLHQGAKSFEIWTGKDAPVEIMRQALQS